MYRYLWEAFYDDGTTVHRFTPEGVEQAPDPWRTRQFKLYSLIDPTLKPVTIYVPRGALFRFFKTRFSGDVDDTRTIFSAGWSMPDAPYGVTIGLLPDGSIEVSH